MTYDKIVWCDAKRVAQERQCSRSTLLLVLSSADVAYATAPDARNLSSSDGLVLLMAQRDRKDSFSTWLSRRMPMIQASGECSDLRHSAEVDEPLLLDPFEH